MTQILRPCATQNEEKEQEGRCSNFVPPFTRFSPGFVGSILLTSSVLSISLKIGMNIIRRNVAIGRSMGIAASATERIHIYRRSSTSANRMNAFRFRFSMLDYDADVAEIVSVGRSASS